MPSMLSSIKGMRDKALRLKRDGLKTRKLVQACRQRSLLQSARVLAWVEDLPAEAALIDRYMADLSV